MKLLSRGSVPAGVTVPCGVMSDDRVAAAHAERARELGAEHDAELAGLAGRRARRARMWLPMSATVSSRAGSMPRTSAPRLASPADEHRLAEHVGRRRLHVRILRRAPRATAAPVGKLSAAPRISMCDATARMRLRNSSWKPFITESTTISAATPSAMPAIEISAMNEMNVLRPEPRRARV